MERLRTYTNVSLESRRARMFTTLQFSHYVKNVHMFESLLDRVSTYAM